MGKLAKAYLEANSGLADSNPTGYQCIQLWGQAQEAKANTPPPPPPPKVSITASFKGEDVGGHASQAMLTNAGLVPQGTPVQSFEQKQQDFRQGQGLPPKPVPEFQPGPQGAPSPPLPLPPLAGQGNTIPTPAGLPQSIQ